jgi:beta-lactam-binding protein with PASTA domain
MKKLLQFLKSRTFIINLMAAVAFLVLLFGFTYKWLNTYTRHGSSVSVPDLRGMHLSRVSDFLKNKSLQFSISDSNVFELDKPPGTVIEQDPGPNEKVKEGRTIYISVSRSTPPGVKIPDLLDNSLRQAEAILRSYGLKTGQLIYKPDLAKNAVLEMQIKGQPVNKGKEVPKGTTIDLVLGDGFGNTRVSVPQLFNLTLQEALFVLNASSLNVGAIISDETVRDSTRARVYRQVPGPSSDAISQGEPIDLFITQSEAVIRQHTEQSNPDSNE